MRYTVDLCKFIVAATKFNTWQESSFPDCHVTVQNNIDKELRVNVSVNPDIEVCIYEHNIKNAASNYMCGINIELVAQLVFQEIQVSVLVQKPLKVVPCSHFFSNLGNSTRFSSYVFLDEALDVPSLEASIKISVITSLGIPRTITKLAMLPIHLVLESCTPEKDNKHKITLVTNQPPIGLNNLFSDYNHDGQSSPNAIGFRSASGNAGAILLAKSSERYRLQSDTFTMLSIMVEQLIVRLKKYYNNVIDFKISFNSSLPSSDILFYVNKHFETKLCINKLQGIVSQLSGQFRLIQKRLIAKYRAKNTTSLKSLELLLNDTYLEIMETTEKLDNELEVLSKSQTNLSCALNLLKQLVELFAMDSDLLKMVHSAFCINVYDLDGQSWEDVMDASLCYLLRTVMAKTEKDKLRAPHTSFDEVKDLTKFEKHLSLVLERLSKHVGLKESDTVFEEVEAQKQDNTEIEEDNQRDEKPIGSQYGEISLRLLSARKSLMKRHQIKDEPQNG
ncbi:unnamed protein product [Ceutorhynchus assimilis]|uniref:PTHB1 C-terminal domain-containing protein n=1 Tax=Ceutorhynchus assimilis TaxID=467358 RepID=A0A9N9MI04_9CUCU|nr:unnamed protein product [Ceutorhynchus assimilis]